MWLKWIKAADAGICSLCLTKITVTSWLASSGVGWSLLSSCAASLSLPVTASCSRHLLCLLLVYALAHFDLLAVVHSQPSSIHPPTLLTFLRFLSLPMSLRLLFFPCQRLSKQSRVCVCVSGLVTRRSSETGELSKEHSCIFIRRPRSAFSRFLPEAPLPFFVFRVWPRAFSGRPAWRKREEGWGGEVGRMVFKLWAKIRCEMWGWKNVLKTLFW